MSPSSRPKAAATPEIELNQDQVIAVLQSALAVFRKDIDSDITAARILTLLSIYKNPGTQQIDMGRLVPDLSISAISRNIVDLGDVMSNRKQGPGLVVQKPDPEYRKRNLLYPTAKAHSLIVRLCKAVNA